MHPDTSPQIIESADGFDEAQKRDIDEAMSTIRLTWIFQIVALIAFSLLAYWTSGMWKNHPVWTSFFFILELVITLVVSFFIWLARDEARGDILAIERNDDY